MDKIEIVQLIENETSKLSPKAREVWEQMETIAEFSESIDSVIPGSLTDIQEKLSGLTTREVLIIQRAAILYHAHSAANSMEQQGKDGNQVREVAVIKCALLKDKEAGRTPNPNMTWEEAISKLKIDSR